MIKNRNGEIINIGGGVSEDNDGSILIRGHAEFEEPGDGENDKGRGVIYQGERFESTAEKPVLVTGTASAVHATDWDGDGDFDLLVGDIAGRVHLVPNKGAADAYAFGEEVRLEVDGQEVKVNGDAGPFAADWDADGDLDLLVGAGDGSVLLFRNIGTKVAPRLAPPQELVGPARISYGSDAPEEPQRGIRAKVCAADWDGDGQLDLLVGDLATQKPDLPEPSKEEQQQRDRIREELEVVQAEYRELVPKMFGPARVKDEKKLAKIRKRRDKLQARIEELRAKLPPEYESHGWVWLFRRTPGVVAPASAAGDLEPASGPLGLRQPF
jgi:hypothetical protein